MTINSSIAFSALVFCPAIAFAQSPGQNTSDSALFSTLIGVLRTEADARDLRVDPRILASDPGLVTLIGPQNQITQPGTSFPLASDSTALAARERWLSVERVRRTDALRDAECPGATVFPSAEAEKQKREFCPHEHFSSALIALPRRGGAYLPNSRIDERADTNVRTVRVLLRDMTPIGTAEEAVDYVFGLGPDRVWELKRRVQVMITE